jgi:hypothetical protein
MRRIAFLGFSTLAILSISGCSGFSGLSGQSNQPAASETFDINSDIDRISQAVNKFDANSARGSAVTSLEEFISVTNANKEILSEIRIAVNEFIGHIDSAWDSLPVEDTADLPSRNKIRNWASGYETWLEYQNKIQLVANECQIASNVGSSWKICILENFNKTRMYESLSKSDLEVAIADIQEWQSRRSALNG